MMKPTALKLLLLAPTVSLLAALATAPAQADTATRVDDSGTVVSQPTVQMQWRQPVPGRRPDHTVQARIKVNVHLNVAPWVNRPVRLYMGLAPLNGPQVQASWSTAGRLMPGTLRSGARTLVYAGPIKTSTFDDAIELTLTTDGRALTSLQSLQFYFEIES